MGIIFLGLVMWILGGWNTDNGDFSNYEAMFTYDIVNMTTSNTPDYGFFLILELFKLLGLSFIQARIVIFLIYVITLSYASLKLSRKPFVVLLLYFITFFFRDVITLRNTIALIFLIHAIVIILDDNTNYKKTKFCILNFIAVTIHISFIIYFLILLVDKKVNLKIIAISSIMLAFVSNPILSIFSGYIISDENGQMQNKVDGMLGSSSYVSLIICSITVIFSVLLCLEAKGLMKKREYVDYKVRLITNMNVVLMVILIMTSLSMTFIRVYYNILLFDMILISNVIIFNKKYTPLQLVWFLWIFLWSFIMSNVSLNFTRILTHNLLI